MVALWLWAASVVPAADTQEFVRRKAPPKQFTGVPFVEPEAAGSTNRVEDNLLPKPSLGSIDQAIRKPFELFKAEDAMDLAPDQMLPRPPAPQPRPPTRQELRKKDLRENWVFSTPEELFGVPSAETMLDLPEFGPDGELKTPKTSFERYLERMEKSRQTGATNQAGGGPLPGWARPEDMDEAGQLRTEDNASTGENTAFGAAAEKKLVESKRPGGYEFLPMAGSSGWQQPAASPESLFNFNATSSPEKPAAKNLAREQRMQEFRQLLDSRPATSPSPSWSVGPSAPLASPATLPPSPSVTYSTPYNRGAASPQLPNSTVLPAPIAPAAGTPSYLAPASTPPPAPATRPQPAASPFNSPFDQPRRKF